MVVFCKKTKIFYSELNYMNSSPNPKAYLEPLDASYELSTHPVHKLLFIPTLELAQVMSCSLKEFGLDALSRAASLGSVKIPANTRPH